MKPIRHHIKTAISTLALMLTLSVGTVFPGVETEYDGTVSPPLNLLPIEEKIPEAENEDGIQPLTDLDDNVTQEQC